MTYVPNFEQLRGLTVDAASSFGMPHVNAYYHGDVKHNRLMEFAECAVCGAPATNSHHEPPLGAGGRNRHFLLQTPRGSFVLRPALIALCGSGTTGCHGERHNGTLRFRWRWHRDYYAEQWWDGYLITRGVKPNTSDLYNFGMWEIIRDGEVIDQITGD